MSYIKLEDLQKIPIRIDHYDEENGNVNFVLGVEYAIEYAENLPKANVVEVASGIVSELPNVELAEVRRGEWIKVPCSEKNGDAHCSECNHWDWSDCNFCSNCGANMRGEKK